MYFVPRVCNNVCMIAFLGTHIPILAPTDGYRDFQNRKGWSSFVLQGVVDDRFMWVFFHGLFILKTEWACNASEVPPWNVLMNLLNSILFWIGTAVEKQLYAHIFKSLYHKHSLVTGIKAYMIFMHVCVIGFVFYEIICLKVQEHQLQDARMRPWFNGFAELWPLSKSPSAATGRHSDTRKSKLEAYLYHIFIHIFPPKLQTKQLSLVRVSETSRGKMSGSK